MFIFLSKFHCMLNLKFPFFLHIELSPLTTCILAFVTSFFLGILFFFVFIKKTSQYGLLEKIKVSSPTLQQQSSSKKNTPTAGGIVITVSFLFSVWLYCDMNYYTIVGVFVVISFAVFGLIDDLIKTFTSQKGLGSLDKLLCSFFLAFIAALILIQNHDFISYICVPGIQKQYLLSEDIFIILATFIIASTSHAVNITDGIDGLAGSCSFLVILFFTITIFYTCSGLDNGHYYTLMELNILNMSLMGSLLAFLCFNMYPAKIFMGDCGALMLGGYIGYIAIICKQELLLIFIGGIFVVETLSSMLQILSKKCRNKKIFICAPLHHHLRAIGWSEKDIVFRFVVIQMLLLVVAYYVVVV